MAPERIIALSVVQGPDEERLLHHQWDEYQIPIELHTVSSPYRELTRPVLAFLDEIAEELQVEPRKVQWMLKVSWQPLSLEHPVGEDEDSEEDVLVWDKRFDVLALLEDELIMAQPLVPRHEVCPTDVEALMHDERETPVPGGQAQSDVPDGQEKPHPFAALAALKKPPKSE